MSRIKDHRARNTRAHLPGGERRSRMLGTWDSLTPKFILVGCFHGPLELQMRDAGAELLFVPLGCSFPLR